MIHTVILAGGWGRRFWPKSREKLPKQLLCLWNRCSSIQNILKNIESEIPKERTWVVANKKYILTLHRHLPFLKKKNFLVEPVARNTAAAIGLASLTIKRLDPEAIILVLSSDHILGQKRLFLKTVKTACEFAGRGDVLVTIGICPDRPAQEFGYLKIVQDTKQKIKDIEIYKVERFVEKPPVQKAKIYIKSKNYLWNSGIFVWRVTSILKAIKRYMPKLYSGLERAERFRDSSLYKDRLAAEYNRFKDVSIDYGVMEKAQNIYTVAGKFFWQDLGSWSSLSPGYLARDSQGNIIHGLHRGIDTKDSIIFSEPGHLIATIGIRNLIVVHTPDATLVCNKDRAQQVRKLIEIFGRDKHLKKYL